MTQNDMAIRIKNFFQNPAYYSNTDVNDSIQDGYDEVVALSGCILKATKLPFTAGLSYYDMISLIPDYLGVYAIYNTAIKRFMLPGSIRKFDLDRIDWETATGVPYYFSVVSHRYMAIYKKPVVSNYGNMYIYYKAIAPTLASGDAIMIPEDIIDQTLEDYCISDLWEQNQEWGKAAVHLNAYGEGLQVLKDIVNGRQPDRLPQLRG